MTDTQMPANADRNLLDEIEELNVLEAEELQEGVAFHAFRFAETTPLLGLDVILNTKAESLVKQLSLPQGATLMTVVGDRMHVVFDPTTVDAKALQKQISASLGGSLTEIKHDEKDRFAFTKLK
jgi:hypothetical protein